MQDETASSRRQNGWGVQFFGVSGGLRASFFLIHIDGRWGLYTLLDDGEEQTSRRGRRP